MHAKGHPSGSPTASAETAPPPPPPPKREAPDALKCIDGIIVPSRPCGVARAPPSGAGRCKGGARTGHATVRTEHRAPEAAGAPESDGPIGPGREQRRRVRRRAVGLEGRAERQAEDRAGV